MEKEFAAEVICKFHKSGKIIPIRFRIGDKKCKGVSDPFLYGAL